MIIRMLVSISGTEFSARPGETLDLDASEGKRLIEAGFAEVVRTPMKKEKAVTVEK